MKFLPTSTDAGETTGTNATAASTAAELKLPSGVFFLITAGAEAIYIKFGKSGMTAVTTSNGFRIGPNATIPFSRPERATHISHIRAGSTDSDISVQGGIAGT